MDGTLDIVIVNWNAGLQLKECLDSLGPACKGITAHVFVVDNGSTDDSLSRLNAYPFSLKTVRNQDNRGFAAACNQGASLGAADYLLFLNPDMRLHSDSLVKPLDFMESPTGAHHAICSIQLHDESGSIQRSCTRHPTPAMLLCNGLGLDRLLPRVFPSHFMREWDHADSRDVDHVIGAFYLVRRRVFEDAGGFDERFFVYLEDLDLSQRIANAGWQIHYLADAQAFHRGGGTSEQIRARRLFFSVRSRLLYGFKHFGPAVGLALALAAVVLEVPVRCVFGAIRLRAGQIAETLAAYAMLVVDLPRIVRTGLSRR
jgi:GT2 family glycosyltransferase